MTVTVRRRSGDLRVEAAATVDARAWDAFVSAHAPANALYSLTAWADYVTAWLPCTPQFVSVWDSEGVRVASWLTFVLPPTALRHGWKRMAALAMRPWAREIAWDGSPVIADGRSVPPVADALRAWLTGPARPAPFVRVHGGPWLLDDAWPDVARWGTYVIDCHGPEEALWASLKSSARKAVRRSQATGVRVHRISSLEAVATYARFIERVARATGRRARPLAELHAAWDRVRPFGHLELFVAEHRDTWISVLGVRGVRDYVSEFGSFQSSADRDLGLHGQDLIKWEIIRWANQSGIRWYDLAGVHPEPTQGKELGIRRFKEKWGGSYREYRVVRPHWLTRWSPSGLGR